MSKIASSIKYLLAVLIFCGGAAVFLYPAISALINEQSQTTVVAQFEEDLQGLSEESKVMSLSEAHEYNRSLLSRQTTLVDPFGNNSEEAPKEYSFLNLGEIMGYVEVPKLGIKLSVHEGTSEAVLQKGAGWLKGTSLPVGGESTHTVLSGHSGLPTAKLFTGLDKLEIGDEFFIRNMSEILAYKVVSKQIIEPSNTDPLAIVEGKDLATLLTCHPYMVNSHRLLVTGERVAYTGQLEEPPSSNPLDNLTPTEKDFGIAVLIAGALIGFCIFFILRSRRKNKIGASDGTG